MTQLSDRRGGAARAASAERATGSGRDVELAGERGLLAGGGVPVEHALGHRAIERADRVVDRRLRIGGIRREGGARGLHGGADRAARRAVALAALLALLHPLDRGSGIGHGQLPLVKCRRQDDTRGYRPRSELSRSLSPVRRRNSPELLAGPTA